MVLCVDCLEKLIGTARPKPEQAFWTDGGRFLWKSENGQSDPIAVNQPDGPLA